MTTANLAVAPSRALSADAFTSPTYTIKRPFWSLLGRKFHVFDQNGQLAMFVKHPILKLRAEFTIFADEAQTQPVALIKAREIIALNVSYDVTDPASGQRIGTLRTKGLKSILRDTWEILNEADQPVGKVEEEGASILRRIFPILTGKWGMEIDGAPVAKIRQIFRFFVKEYAVDMTPGHGKVDPRFVLAAALLALMKETQREDSN